MDADSISVGGLSAGGHMTAVLSQFARDENIPLKLQLMVVPSVDLRWEIAEEPQKSEVAAKYPSVALFAANPWGPQSPPHHLGSFLLHISLLLARLLSKGAPHDSVH